VTESFKLTLVDPLRHYFRSVKGGNGHTAEVVYDRLVVPYFQQWHPRIELTGGVAATVTSAVTSGFFSYLSKNISNHLIAKDVTAFAHDLQSVGIGGVVLLVSNTAQYYITQNFGLSWSAWVRERCAEAYFSKEKRHTFLARDSRLAAEQHIVDTSFEFVNQSRSLGSSLLTSATFGLSFFSVLCGESPLLGAGSLLFAASSVYWARRQETTSVASDQGFTIAKSGYRAIIVDAAKHIKDIAVRGGESAAQAVMSKRLHDVNDIDRSIIRQDTMREFIRTAHETVSLVYPYLFLAPFYLMSDGTTHTPGGLALSVAAFQGFRGSCDWYSRNGKNIAKWRSAALSLAKFLDDCGTVPDVAVNLPVYESDTAHGLIINNLRVDNSRGKALIEGISVTLKPGDRFVISSQSGKGKTTLLRTLRGMKPIAEGAVTYRGVSDDPHDIFSLPQNPYVPDLSLREILSYPKSEIAFSDQDMTRALREVGLDRLIRFLEKDHIKGHDLELSGEEGQRLSFALVLLYKPKIILFDEAIANFHDKKEGVDLYKTVLGRLPDSIIISASNEACIRQLHNVRATVVDRKLVMEENGAVDLGVGDNPVILPSGIVPSMPFGGRADRFGPHLAKCL